MSKCLFFALATLIGTITADVAHLDSSYLPPTPAATANLPADRDLSFSTTIEKQELHELPTQIEYVQDEHMAYNNNDMAMPTSMNKPPAMLQGLQQQQMHITNGAPAMPPRSYLGPMVQRPEAHTALDMSTQQNGVLTPIQHKSEMMSNYYFAPGMEAGTPQFNHRQYQQPVPMPDEFVQQHRQQMLQYMRSVAAVEATPQEQKMDPAAAHTLATDGYHYTSNGNGQRTFRTRS